MMHSTDQNPTRGALSPWLVAMTAVVALVLVGLIGLNALRPPAVGTDTENSNTQIINSIRTTEEISLLSLGIQGIAEQTQQRTVFGMRVPGADRALFLQYHFTAKLGMDGRQVRIQESGEQELTISFPEFIFIGHDDVTFKLAAEKNGVLSWVTPEIDTMEMTNSVLNDETQQRYVDENEELLRTQAQAFYKGIVHAIDPEMRLEFDYISGR